ncbi:MAG: dihydrolipoyl dehydrogenase [Alphaproteobacteria bacterium CG11_big_fil_rev_8_21_14_0_20_44_7]|nr:MAG: dihydrolipoyl dehydrogenase [Alphaproteobacteria bacterium CG11_big_fil_rev_8_21_14_0_20_44_7]
MTDNKFDVIIIGGGPGGYVCAIRAAQLGLKVACVEKRGALGGTCLNVGCIPSKALLESSHQYENAQHNFAEQGIEVSGLKVNFGKMMERKNKVVKQLTGGIEMLFKKNKITYIKGAGEIISTNKVKVGNDEYSAKKIVIATGSDVAHLPGIEIDEEVIVSSTGALELKEIPKKMVVIGAGVIGLELGSVYRRLGAEVTAIEFLDRITPGMDNGLTKDFQKSLEKQGIKFKLGTKVTGAEKTKSGVKLTMEAAKGGNSETMEADVVLVCVGRKAYTENLGLDKVGVKTTERGLVETNANWQTNVPNIYAIGDVIKGPMLAHKAEEEGVAVAEVLAGQHGHVNYNAIPGVIYTHPEVASVGKTEEELKEAGIEYNVGKFSFMANGRALANGDAEGYAKILADKKTDEVLGIHIIGPHAGDLIAECTMAIEFGASSEDIARTCHAHPTISEVVKEAALAVEKRALHS